MRRSDGLLRIGLLVLLTVEARYHRSITSRGGRLQCSEQETNRGAAPWSRLA